LPRWLSDSSAIPSRGEENVTFYSIFFSNNDTVRKIFKHYELTEPEEQCMTDMDRFRAEDPSPPLPSFTSPSDERDATPLRNIWFVNKVGRAIYNFYHLAALFSILKKVAAHFMPSILW
jgi:hypothetical protein